MYPTKIIIYILLAILTFPTILFVGEFPTINAAPPIQDSTPSHSYFPLIQKPPLTEADFPQPFTFGYGVSVAEPDSPAVQAVGFNWMKVFDPPNRRQQVNVLYRLDINRWSMGNDYWDMYQFEQELYWLAGRHGQWIEAYEIGNEVNLYVDGWEGPPDAAAYVDLLCTASAVIKIMDPDAIIVSAGLAPVGRVVGNWQDHRGHNYRMQDEREYLREFIAVGGLGCADVVGIHPMGFRADFDAEPDLHGGTPATNCENGFCFRSAEVLQQILAESGYADKKVWATEIGWIAEPTDSTCLDDYSWSGRAWQRVTRQQQADNLAGAFTYARTQWPWMEAMFVFNLNFDQAPYYHNCEQMRYYSIQGTATETALRRIDK